MFCSKIRPVLQANSYDNVNNLHIYCSYFKIYSDVDARIRVTASKNKVIPRR